MRQCCNRVIQLKKTLHVIVIVVGMLLVITPTQANAGSDNGIKLTFEERQYLQSHGTLIFVSQTNYPPFEFLQKDNSMDGICIELARYMVTELGVKSVFTNMSFQQAQEAVLSGKADVLTSFFYSEKRSEQFTFTEPLFDVPASIFVRSDRPDIARLEDLKGKRIAIQRGDYAKDFLESKGISFQLVQTDNFAQATEAVISGLADALIGDEQVVLHYLYSNNQSDMAKKVGEPLYIGKNCMAIRKGNDIVYSLITKALQHARKANVIENTQRKWFGKELPAPEGWLSRWKPYLIFGGISFFALIVLIVAINWKLRRLVTEKTMAVELKEEYYRKLIDNAADAIFVHNVPEGQIIDCNNQACISLGYCRDELLRLSVQDIDALFKPERDEKAWRELKVNSSVTLEGLHKRKDGSLLPVEVKISITSHAGRLLVYAAARDVSERKKMEMVIFEERHFLSSVIERATEGICVCQAVPDFPFIHFTVWNPCMTEITGYSMEEINRLGWYQSLYPDENTRNRAIKRMEEMRAGLDIMHEQWVITRNDGDKRTISISTSIIVSNDKNIHVLGIINDVTEEMESLRVLKSREALYAGIFNHIGIGLSVIGADLKQLSMNPVMNKWFPNRKDTGQHTCYWSLHNPPRDVSCEECPIAKSLLQGTVYETITHTPTEDGIRNYKIVTTPVFNTDGSIAAFVELFEDITERVTFENCLQQAKTAAETANRAKSEFLANMSHEIRTPMNGVLGMTQLLEMTPLTAEQREYVESLKMSGKSMLALISDILDLSRVEAGKFRVELVPFNLRNCIDDIVLIQKSLIQAKELQLVIDVASDIPAILVGDQQRVKQILLNLLGNATKFTEHGSITISALKLEQEERSVFVQLAIRDTGIGISAAALPTIFSPFVQEDGSTTRKYGGSGLGLSICQRMVELMGGSISVESRQGVGSCFTLTIPFSLEVNDEHQSANALTTTVLPKE
ncbi:MAG: transporter substrate-binding domain-containing protein [Desulfuromonadaceae bacterium]|nr:transporter substrate-binding domain-containing protein [Desulfuromonadaceae bacterium]